MQPLAGFGVQPMVGAGAEHPEAESLYTCIQRRGRKLRMRMIRYKVKCARTRLSVTKLAYSSVRT